MNHRRLLLLAAVVVLVADAVLVAGRVGQQAPADAGTGAPPRAEPETTDEQFTRVARIVEEVRGLRFGSLPQPTYLPPRRLARRAARLADDYTDEMADADRRILAALGAIPPTTDLRALLRDALAQGVVGFYDPDSGELVVRARRAQERLSPLEELILAHELQHALADQHLGLPDPSEEPGKEDAAFAAQALVEGDATLTMQRYAEQALSVVDQLRLAAEGLRGGELQPTGEMPHYIRRSLEFPYQEGLAFVRRLVAEGGWEAVDAAYGRPPTSTAEVLFPERYLAQEQPVGVAAPLRLGPPWQERAVLALGAADLLLLFEAPGGDPGRALANPSGAAAGWNGGVVHLWAHQADSALGIALATRPGHDLCGAVAAWYQAAFPEHVARPRAGDERLVREGGGQAAVVRCTDAEVRLGVGPDVGIARHLAAA